MIREVSGDFGVGRTGVRRYKKRVMDGTHAARRFLPSPPSQHPCEQTIGPSTLKR